MVITIDSHLAFNKSMYYATVYGEMLD